MKKRTLEQHRQVYYKKICGIGKKGLLNAGLDKVVITFGIIAMMNWAYWWFKRDGRGSAEEVAKNVASVFMNGILDRKV